jgi:hypothetical protein
VRIEWIHCNEESSGNKVLCYHYRKYSRSVTRVVLKYLSNFCLQIVFKCVSQMLYINKLKEIICNPESQVNKIEFCMYM